MANQQFNFFQRNSSGAPLTAATITTTSLYDDGGAGPVIGNAVELDAANQPGFYYFIVDVAATKVLTVVTDAGAGVTDANNRYQAFVINDTPLDVYSIADRVWDEGTGVHVAGGSFGLALGTTLQASVAALPTAAQNADAVWDETTAPHATPNTFGRALGTTLQTTLSTLPFGTADAVWDEQRSGHVAGGSFGLALGTTLPASVAALPTAAQNADAVWDESTAAHVGAGSFGLSLGTTLQTSIGALPTAAQNADAVWDESIAGHVIVGSFGYELGTKVPDDIDNLPGEVWNIPIASHLIPGSTGKTLNDLATGSTPAAIATAVWAALVASNQSVGSFGQAVTIMQALQHRNWRFVGGTYSGTPPRLTAATLKLYPTKADADADTNAILSQVFTASYDGSGQLTAAKQTDV